MYGEASLPLREIECGGIITVGMRPVTTSREESNEPTGVRSVGEVVVGESPGRSGWGVVNHDEAQGSPTS